MIDQATELRRLARQWAAQEGKPATAAPRKVVVSAGKGGVGATTVAVNLAVALAEEGCRTILVDADLTGADAAQLCGVEARDSIADVLGGRRTIHEVMQPGPAGIQIVPGIWSPGAMPDCSPSAQQRLIRQLDQLGRHADVVIVDAGNGLTHVVQRFWQAADQVLLVTTAEAVSILDGYAAVKLFVDGAKPPAVQTIVNQAPENEVASDVHLRIGQACQKFLGLEVSSLGAIPWDAAVAIAARNNRPLMLDQAQSPAAQEIQRIALALLATFDASTKSLTAKRRAA